MAVVLHIAQATLTQTDEWFQQPDFMAATHYMVGKDGAVHQYVREEDAAWGNGRPDNATWSLMPDCNPNLVTISIEHEGFTGEPWTEPMYQADVVLVSGILDRWDIPADRDHIIGHFEIDSVTRSFCPGTGLPWDRLLADLQPTSGAAQFTAPGPPSP